MQLDRTAIVIRERGMMEILDLSLHVIRSYLPPLMATFLLGVLPFLVVDRILLGWLIELDPRDYSPSEYNLRVARYCFTLAMLVVLQAPLATSLIVAWLGKAVFSERPPVMAAIKDWGSVWWRLLLLQGFVRCSLTATVAAALILANDELTGSEMPLIAIMTVIVCLVRAVRPFLTEIILLEKNPLRSSTRSPVITIGKRNNSLHASGSGTLFFVFMGSGLIAFCLSAALFYTFLFFQGVMLNTWKMNTTMLLYALPLSMWLCAGLLTVFRFLCYLDLRIRQEGWAIELRMRAEAARLQGDLMLSP